MGTVSNVKVKPQNVSWNAVDLGLIEGDITLTFSEEMFDVKAHQTGANILDKIRTGMNLESIKLSLQETSAAQLKAMVEASGDAVTPAGLGATEVYGYGVSKLFTNLSADAHKLIFHPISASGPTDYANDICFWKAVPMVKELNFSGEKNSMIQVEFVILPDDTKL